MKKVKVLALVSAIATALLLFVFLNSLNQSTGNIKVSVLAAASDIPANTLITGKMIKTTELYSEAVIGGAITEETQVIGKISQTEIFAGEQFLSAKLVATGDTSDSKTLAYVIEPGMRAISIAVDETSGLAYMLTPGNRVDLIGEFVSTTNGNAGKISYTTMVAENVTVIALDNIFSKEGKINSDKPEYTTLTLQVTPKQAMELSMAQFEGQLRVILRSPADVRETNQPSLTLGNVMVK